MVIRAILFLSNSLPMVCFLLQSQIHRGESSEESQRTQRLELVAARYFAELSSIIIWAPTSKGTGCTDFFFGIFHSFWKTRNLCAANSDQHLNYHGYGDWVRMVMLVILAFSVLVTLQTVSPSNLCSTAGLCCKHRDRFVLTRILLWIISLVLRLRSLSVSFL